MRSLRNSDIFAVDKIGRPALYQEPFDVPEPADVMMPNSEQFGLDLATRMNGSHHLPKQAQDEIPSGRTCNKLNDPNTCETILTQPTLVLPVTGVITLNIYTWVVESLIANLFLMKIYNRTKFIPSWCQSWMAGIRGPR